MARIPLNATGNPVQLTNAAVTYYTVPAATKAIIRHIHVSNPSGGSVNFTLSNGLASNAALRLYDAMPVAAGSILGGPGGIWRYDVLEAGMIIQALASASTTLVFSMDLDTFVLG